MTDLQPGTLKEKGAMVSEALHVDVTHSEHHLEYTRHSYSARSARLRRGIAVLFITLVAAAALSQHGRMYDPPPIAPDCLLGLGGGAARRGGSFPHFTYESCKPQIQAYFTEIVGLYYVQVAHVAFAAIDYVQQLSLTTPPTRDQVFVFDIDETVLSNKEEWTTAPPGAHTWPLSRWVASLAAGHAGCGGGSDSEKGAQRATPTPRATWEERRPSPSAHSALSMVKGDERPPLVAVRQLYLYLLAHNYSVAFITGRREAGRPWTVQNLKAAGFGEECVEGWRTGAAPPPDTYQPPCYVALHLRAEDDDRPASVYKPERRKALIDQGYTLIGNIGDQFSDLEGLYEAGSSWKLPNPVYYIL